MTVDFRPDGGPRGLPRDPPGGEGLGHAARQIGVDRFPIEKKPNLGRCCAGGPLATTQHIDKFLPEPDFGVRAASSLREAHQLKWPAEPTMLSQARYKHGDHQHKSNSWRVAVFGRFTDGDPVCHDPF